MFFFQRSTAMRCVRVTRRVSSVATCLVTTRSWWAALARRKKTSSPRKVSGHSPSTRRTGAAWNKTRLALKVRSSVTRDGESRIEVIFSRHMTSILILCRVSALENLQTTSSREEIRKTASGALWVIYGRHLAAGQHTVDSTYALTRLQLTDHLVVSWKFFATLIAPFVNAGSASLQFFSVKRLYSIYLF